MYASIVYTCTYFFMHVSMMQECMLAACDIFEIPTNSDFIAACKYLLGDFIVKNNLNMHAVRDSYTCSYRHFSLQGN